MFKPESIELFRNGPRGRITAFLNKKKQKLLIFSGTRMGWNYISSLLSTAAQTKIHNPAVNCKIWELRGEPDTDIIIELFRTGC